MLEALAALPHQAKRVVEPGINCLSHGQPRLDVVAVIESVEELKVGEGEFLHDSQSSFNKSSLVGLEPDGVGDDLGRKDPLLLLQEAQAVKSHDLLEGVSQLNLSFADGQEQKVIEGPLALLGELNEPGGNPVDASVVLRESDEEAVDLVVEFVLDSPEFLVEARVLRPELEVAAVFIV